MSALYTLTKTLKACLFTTALYGWLVPTTFVANQLNEWMPTRQLTSTDWVIESGQPNASWDLVTLDGTDSVDASDDELVPQGSDSLETTVETSPSHTEPSTTEEQVSSKVDGLIGTKSDHVATHVSNTSSTDTRHPLAKGLPNHTAKRFMGKRKTARKGKCEVENPNITKSGKNAYSLPKSTLKHYSTHWKDASRLAHLTWAMKGDGSRLGIRIRGISCKSPLKFTGLRHGDVVLSINDHSVQSEKDLLKVYSRLLFWKKVDVKVKRGNRTLTLKYKIT